MKNPEREAMEQTWYSYMEAVAAFTKSQMDFEKASTEFRSWATYGSYTDTSECMRHRVTLAEEALAARLAYLEFQTAEAALSSKGEAP